MTKIHIVIDLDKLPKQTKEELLDTLYHVEDDSYYNCKSVSKAIDTLQNDLFQNEE